MRLPTRRLLGALAAPCVLAGALSALSPAGPAVAAACATPAQQAMSRAISHQIPGHPGTPPPCGTVAPRAHPQVSTADPVSDVFAAVHATSASDVCTGGAPSSNDTVLSGSIVSPGCTTFSVSR